MAKSAPKPVSKAVAALKAALPADMKVISVPAGATVLVEVDVNDMVIPYTVALDGDVVIKSLVDQREEISPLTAGVHRLGWAFAHAAKGWKHTLTLVIDGKRTILEQMSEADKDPDHSVDVAFLSVA